MERRGESSPVASWQASNGLSFPDVLRSVLAGVYWLVKVWLVMLWQVWLGEVCPAVLRHGSHENNPGPVFP